MSFKIYKRESYTADIEPRVLISINECDVTRFVEKNTYKVLKYFKTTSEEVKMNNDCQTLARLVTCIIVAEKLGHKKFRNFIDYKKYRRGVVYLEYMLKDAYEEIDNIIKNMSREDVEKFGDYVLRRFDRINNGEESEREFIECEDSSLNDYRFKENKFRKVVSWFSSIISKLFNFFK